MVIVKVGTTGYTVVCVEIVVKSCPNLLSGTPPQEDITEQNNFHKPYVVQHLIRFPGSYIFS